MLDIPNLDELDKDSKKKETKKGEGNGIKEAPIERFHRDENQPRQEFDKNKLQAVGKSMQKRGQKLPISVRPHPEIEGDFIINDGERRWRSAKLVGLKTLKYFIDEDFDDLDQTVAGTMQENLRPHELANIIKRKIDDDKMKQKEIAEELSMSVTMVSRYYGIAELPDVVQSLYDDKVVTHYRVLYDLKNLYGKNRELALELVKYAVEQGGLTVKTIQEAIKANDLPRGKNEEKKEQEKKEKDPAIASLETRISEKLGIKSSINFNEDTKKSVLKLSFDDLDILDGFLETLGISEKDL